MNHRNTYTLRTFMFLLLLAVGPLQAQAVFACAMMDMPVHQSCCCDDHRADDACGGSDGDSNLMPSKNPCCERTIQVSVDEDSKEDNPIAKPAEVRSDVDPPQTSAIPPVDFALLTQRPQLAAYTPPPPASLSGSRTYLVTQRLRI